jgi:hypothetical protein
VNAKGVRIQNTRKLGQKYKPNVVIINLLTLHLNILMHGIYDFICDIELYLFKYFHTNEIMLPYVLHVLK